MLRAPLLAQHPPGLGVGRVLGARVGIDTAALTPAMLATLKHAASMANPAFYDRQRRRISTWGVPRFLHSFDETLDGRLMLPRGLLDVVATVVEEAGSTLVIGDERIAGEPQTGFASPPNCARTSSGRSLTWQTTIWACSSRRRARARR